MHSIIIIIPYFGSLPNYFNLWLSSCKYNSSIDWMILTDQELEGLNIPCNVHIKHTTLQALKEKIQGLFDFQISLDSPYKLCDYRPAYGEVFSEEIKGYDFWGFGDIDLIYGNIRKFVTDELLNSFDRVFAGGHLSICKNSEKVNSVYRNRVDGCFYYKDVFTSPRNWTFDEFGQNLGGGYYQICQNSQITVFNKKLYADIETKYRRLQCDFGGSPDVLKQEYKKKNVFFEFSEGTLIQHWDGDNNQGKEIAYIHLQKRDMINRCNNDNRVYYIYPNEFTDICKKRFLTLGYNPKEIRFRINRVLHLLRGK